MAGSSSDPHDITKHSELLKPLRKLSQNWEIDITAHLEEYIAELAEVRFTSDGEAEGGEVNFVEAALLIQGSVGIYCKKVEYLYTQVNDALATMSGNDSGNKKVNQSVDTSQTGANETGLQDDEEKFLTLDDDIHVSDGCFIRKEPETLQAVLHRMPSFLMKVDQGNHSENLTTGKGEVIGNVNDFILNSPFYDEDGLAHIDPKFRSKNLKNVKSLTDDLATAAGDSEPMETSYSEPADIMNMLPADCYGDGPPDDHSVGSSIDIELPELPTDKSPPKTRTGLRSAQKVEKKKKYDNYYLCADAHVEDNLFRKPFKLRHRKKLTVNSGKRKRNKAEQISDLSIRTPQPINDFINSTFCTNVSKFSTVSRKLPFFKESNNNFWECQNEQTKKFQLRNKQLMDLAVKVDLSLKDIVLPEMDIDDEDDDDDDDDDDDVMEPLDIWPSSSDQPVIHDTASLSQSTYCSSYEDHVRMYLEQFVENAHRYAVETNLTKRVQQWEDKISPHLLLQEQKEPYDMHRYRYRVMDRFKHVDDCKTFSDIAGGEPPYEVSRLFLASLMLANVYNIEIQSEGVMSESVNTMTLKSLDQQQHYEHLQ